MSVTTFYKFGLDFSESDDLKAILNEQTNDYDGMTGLGSVYCKRFTHFVTHITYIVYYHKLCEENLCFLNNKFSSLTVICKTDERTLRLV